MLSRFVRQHPPQESDGGEVASGIPVIAIEAPPVPEERRFYAEILWAGSGTNLMRFRG